ncbi:MAG: c-type cytochrome [Planctomycetota bacterium]|jgi:mono/diheme cytochrome c family protein
MIRSPFCVLVAALALAGPVRANDDEQGAAPAALPKHSRAPHGVSLVVNERQRVISPGEEFIDALAGEQPARFSEQDDHWVDALGEYEWDEEEEIYWQWIGPDVLTRGRQDFVQFCASCHGLDGDGYGRSGQALRPPPRSFLQSTFKFTKVTSEYLPSDEALVELVKNGLDGTPMYPWAVSDQRLNDIVQYIKALSPEDEGWRDPVNEIGEPVATPEDTWTAPGGEGLDAAIEAGRIAYHNVQCYSCHPAYVPAAEINRIRNLPADTGYAEDLHLSKLKRDSAFEVEGYRVAIPSPDFTWHTLRSGREAADVYRTIAAGIGGAGMPTWQGAMPDEDIWAIAHYVRHLVDTYKDKPARAAFMAGLRSGD